MKRFILLLLVVAVQSFGKDVGNDITFATSGSGTVAGRAKSVTFIFNNPCIVTIITGSGVAFDGSVDRKLILVAPPGDTISDITYTVVTGSMKIIRTM